MLKTKLIAGICLSVVLSSSSLMADAIMKGDIASNKSIATTVHYGKEHMVNFWNTKTGLLINSLSSGQNGTISAIAISPDGQYTAVGTDMYGGDNHELVIIDTKSAKILHQIRVHPPQIVALKLSILDLQFSPDSKKLLVGAGENLTFIFDAKSGKEISRFQTRVGGRTGSTVTWLPNMKQVILGSGNIAALVNIKDGKIVTKYKDIRDPKAINITKNGKIAVAASRTSVIIFNVKTGKTIKEIKHGQLVTDAVIEPSGAWVACSDAGNLVTIYDVKSGKKLKQVTIPSEYVEVADRPNARIGGLAIDGKPTTIFISTPNRPFMIPLNKK